MRWVIVTGTICWFLFALSKAAQLGPQTEEEEFIPKDHPIMIPLNILNDNFTTAEEANMKVYFYFGIKDID